MKNWKALLVEGIPLNVQSAFEEELGSVAGGAEVSLVSRQDTHLVSVDGVTIFAAHSTQNSCNDGRFSFLQ